MILPTLSFAATRYPRSSEPLAALAGGLPPSGQLEDACIASCAWREVQGSCSGQGLPVAGGFRALSWGGQKQIRSHAFGRDSVPKHTWTTGSVGFIGTSSEASGTEHRR